MANFKHRINPDSTELERYFLSVYTGNLWDALEKIKDWHSPEHIEKEVQMKLLKLQQQALPVVPECVGDGIAWDEQSDKSIAEVLKDVFTTDDKDLKEAGLWIKNNPEKYIIARNIGYQVEKPQLFYLKATDSRGHECLNLDTSEKSIFLAGKKQYDEFQTKFTLEEIKGNSLLKPFIDKIVPVEDGE